MTPAVTFRVENGEQLVHHLTPMFSAARGFAVGLVAADAPLAEGLRIVHDDGGEPRVVWTYDPNDGDFAEEASRWRALFLASQRPELN